jgi:hypothetical protein
MVAETIWTNSTAVHAISWAVLKSYSAVFIFGGLGTAFDFGGLGTAPPGKEIQPTDLDPHHNYVGVSPPSGQGSLRGFARETRLLPPCRFEFRPGVGR